MKVLSHIVSSIDVNDYQLIIKPHPREDIRKYESLLEKLGNKNVKIAPRDKNINLIEMILISDVCVTFTSTSGLLVLACKKPLITLDVFQLPYESAFKGYPLNVTDVSEFSDLLDHLKRNNFRLTRDLYNEVIHKYLYKLDGKASLRVAKIAFKLLKLKTKLG